MSGNGSSFLFWVYVKSSPLTLSNSWFFPAYQMIRWKKYLSHCHIESCSNFLTVLWRFAISLSLSFTHTHTHVHTHTRTHTHTHVNTHTHDLSSSFSFNFENQFLTYSRFCPYCSNSMSSCLLSTATSISFHFLWWSSNKTLILKLILVVVDTSSVL